MLKLIKQKMSCEEREELFWDKTMKSSIEHMITI